MEDYLNKWLYLETLYYRSGVQEINKLEFIHPDDWDFVINNLTNTVNKCIGFEGDYLIIKSKRCTIRVRQQVIKSILPSSQFKWGDIVCQVKKPEINVIVENLIWHHKDQKYYYQISISGKNKSRRYAEDELQMISAE